MEMAVVVVVVVPVVIQPKALQDWVAGHKHTPPECPEHIRNHEARAAAASQQRIIIWAALTPMAIVMLVVAPHGPGS